MSNFKIIEDAGALNKGIVLNAENLSKTQDEMHVHAVSVLVHAALGGIQPLRTFDKLILDQNPNLRTSFNQFVRRFQTELIDGKAVSSNMKFLEYTKKGGWALIRDTNAERTTFIKHAEENLINPNGKEHKRFYERDNVAEEKAFTSADVTKRLKALLAMSSKDGSDVSDEMYSLLKNTVLSAERLTVATPAHAGTVH